MEELRAALKKETAVRRRLELALKEVLEKERRRLAQRLHDTVCQSLTAVYFMAKSIENRLRESRPQEVDELGGLCDMIHGVTGELREVTRSLQPGESHSPQAGPKGDR